MSDQTCTCRRLYPSGRAAKNLDPKCPVHGAQPATAGDQFGRLVKKLEDAMGDKELPSVLAVPATPEACNAASDPRREAMPILGDDLIRLFVNGTACPAPTRTEWRAMALEIQKRRRASASPDALRVAFERGRAAQAKISEADSVKYWRERAEVAEAVEPCTGSRPTAPSSEETDEKCWRAAAHTYDRQGLAKAFADFFREGWEDGFEMGCATPCAGVAEAAQEVVSEIVRENLPKPAVQTAIAKTPCVHGYTWLCPHGCMPDLTSAPNSCVAPEFAIATIRAVRKMIGDGYFQLAKETLDEAIATWSTLTKGVAK